METDFYKCNISKYEYCIFLDNNTIACYLDQLKHMSFQKNKLIVDQLFYSGNKENRFIVFDVINGMIDYNTAKNIVISHQMKKKIDSLIVTKYDDICSMWLSNYDYNNLLNEMSH